MQTTAQPYAPTTLKTTWSKTLWYLGLTFGLTWLLDLVLYLNGGLSNPVTMPLLQLQMLIPAFCALLLGAFFFKESPIYYQINRTASRWFVYYYLLLSVIYLLGAIAGMILPDQITTISTLLLIPSVLGLILLIVLRLIGGKEAFSRTGLAGGKWTIWLLYGLGLVAFYGLQTYLNYVFKLGEVVDLTTAMPQLQAANLPAEALLPILALNTVVIGPFLGLILGFGEEYGWRGFLQNELIRLGRIRGVFLLGVIWGIWHWPVIWMGYNFPGQPILGSIAMVAVCIILSYFLAHAVFKSKGIWTAAYLHALNNQALSFFIIALVKPNDMLLSFGVGLPSLALGALIVLLLLRDPVWRENDSK